VSGEPRAGEAKSPAQDRPPLLGLAVTIVGVAVLAALVLSIEPLRDGVSDAISGDTARLRGDLRGLGVTGGLIVFGLALAHVVIWYPAEILDTAVGFVYDFWIAFPLVMAAWVVNGVVAYWIGRHAARPVLYRFIESHRFAQLEDLAERGGVSLLLAMRLVPVIPFSLFSYVAGAAHVPFGRFVWTTAVGYIPLTVVFVYLGTRLEELSPTDPLLWAGAAVLIGLVYLTHRFRRSLGAETGEEAADRTAR
jgi:uncharacterized membrane protein YdjX (TVP38/TMEM64 family)